MALIKENDLTKGMPGKFGRKIISTNEDGFEHNKSIPKPSFRAGYRANLLSG